MTGLLTVLDGRPGPPVLVLATIGVAVLLAATVRLVPRAERLLVTRDGRVRRVLGPGLVVVLPGVERVQRVSLEPIDLALIVRATTVDRIPLIVVATSTVRVVDPARTFRAGPLGPVDSAGEAVEEATTTLLSTLPLTAVPTCRRLLEQDLATHVTAQTRQWGVEVTSVQVTGIETEVSTTLLDAMRARP